MDQLEIIAIGSDLTIKRLSVSGWSIAQQLDHSMKVIEHILPILLKGKVLTGPNLGFFGKIILFLDWIPRGRVQAPKFVLGQECDKNVFLQRLFKLKETLNLLDETKIANKSKIFKHPKLGLMNFNEALKFICTHTKHHLKIIEYLKR